VTVGIDNYHTQNEVYREESKDQETPNPQNVNLEFVESEKGEFDRVISKLEIFVIKNKSIFDGG